MQTHAAHMNCWQAINKSIKHKCSRFSSRGHFIIWFATQIEMLTRIIIAICICLFNSAMAKSLLHGMEKLTLLNHFVIQLFRVNVNGIAHGSSSIRRSVCGRLMRLAELFERASDFSADYCLMVLKCCYLWLYYVNLHHANADGKIINNSPMFYCSFMQCSRSIHDSAVAAVKLESREFQLILFSLHPAGT